VCVSVCKVQHFFFTALIGDDKSRCQDRVSGNTYRSRSPVFVSQTHKIRRIETKADEISLELTNLSKKQRLRSAA
jgi:hypothetical protein